MEQQQTKNTRRDKIKAAQEKINEERESNQEINFDNTKLQVNEELKGWEL